MIGKDKKQDDLEKLKRFITASNIQGFASYEGYRYLRSKYPFQFIQLMKKYRDINKAPERVKFDDELIKQSINFTNGLYMNFRKYLIHPPENEEEIKDFDMRVNLLEDLLLKQNMEN